MATVRRHCSPDELFGGFGPLQVAPHGRTVRIAAFLDQLFSRDLGLFVIKEHLRPGLDENSHCGGADAAGATRDQRYFPIERQGYWHSK
jgi:hypothetical protein